MLLLLVFAAILSTTTAAVIQNSNQNSTYHGLRAHKVIASWEEAQQICHSEGAYLASPVSAGLLQDMKYFIDANHIYNTYLIGTRAWLVPGQYVSIEGIALEDMPVFHMLERLDPVKGNCLSMDEHTISVVSCWMPLPFICRLNNTKSNSVMVNNMSLNNTTLDNTMLNNTSLNSTTLDNTMLNNTSLNSTTLDNTMLNNMSLNSTTLDNTMLNNTSLNGTTLDNTMLNNTSLNSTTLDNTMLNNTSLNSTTLDKTIWNSTMLNSSLLNLIMSSFRQKQSCTTEGYVYAPSTDRCYKYHEDEDKGWYDVKATCETEGGHLLIINDDNEAQVIQTLFPSRDDHVYVGIRDRRPGYGDWTSIDGTPVALLYNVWDDASDLRNRDYDCATIRLSGELHNIWCGAYSPFLCEQRPNDNVF